MIDCKQVVVNTQKDKYDIEADDFRKTFFDFRHLKIVLYGIGRRTLTLLPRIHDFNIVGLLDRDPQNIGKFFYDVLVFSLEDAEKQSDMIIINSDSSNYLSIYRRIRNTKLPVYYSNGKKASVSDLRDSHTNDDILWKADYYKIKDLIDKYPVISFDIFDTLIARKTADPSDLFEIMSKCYTAISKKKSDFKKIRQQAVSTCCDGMPSIDDIYSIIKKNELLSNTQVNLLFNNEIDNEKKITYPRDDLIKLFDYAVETGKTVLLVSDMYLTSEILGELLFRYTNHSIPQEKIFVSCEQKAEKNTGILWSNVILKQYNARQILHIGDNWKGDVEKPQRFGITCCPIMGIRDMIAASCFRDVLSIASSLPDRVVVGLLGKKLFESPFISSPKYKLVIDKSSLGYCIYGPIVIRYLLWMLSTSRSLCNRRIIFLARDGYFLYEDYKFFSEIVKNRYGIMLREALFLPISRRLVLVAALPDSEAWKELLSIPFSGTFRVFLQSRFNVIADERTESYNDKLLQMDGDIEQIEELITPYKDSIDKELEREKQCYCDYLDKNQFMNQDYDDVLMDLGCQGTNQYYLQKITKKKYVGRYFYANLKEDNAYLQECDINACFQHEDDLDGHKSSIRQNSVYLESFFTAPYGMIRYIDSNGQFVCEKEKNNQLHFHIKDQINMGVKSFITDYFEIMETMDNNISIDLVDSLYKTVWSSGCLIEHSTAESFYFDNDMIGSAEQKLF